MRTCHDRHAAVCGATNAQLTFGIISPSSQSSVQTQAETVIPSRYHGDYNLTGKRTGRDYSHRHIALCLDAITQLTTIIISPRSQRAV